MSEIKCNDATMHTYGQLPEINQKAPDFLLTDIDLKNRTLEKDYANQAVLINVYPSLDTSVCFESLKKFHADLKEKNIMMLGVSMDTPFALKRITNSLDFKNIHLLSDIKNRYFGASYGVTIACGPLGGFLTRAVFLLDETHSLIHRELVENIANPPHYEAILSKLT
ncbi:MAG: thiol peroxidase [Legionellaceae bacterium]|nr:thiol peroxidase [Legionellaceae bacterium]